MTALYAAFFFFLSLIAVIIFLLVPRLRRYAVRAFVIPLAFGFWSIVGMISSVFVFHALRLEFVQKTLAGWSGFIIMFFTYVVPGAVGAWLTVLLLNLKKVPGTAGTGN